MDKQRFVMLADTDQNGELRYFDQEGKVWIPEEDSEGYCFSCETTKNGEFLVGFPFQELCSDCWELHEDSKFVRCNDCGKPTHENLMILESDGLICRECFDHYKV